MLEAEVDSRGATDGLRVVLWLGYRGIRGEVRCSLNVRRRGEASRLHAALERIVVAWSPITHCVLGSM